MTNPFCEAILGHDGQYVTCDRCGLWWDVNDPFPPDCQFEANQESE